MKVLVCGGRDYNDYERVLEVLDGLNPTSVVHGGASGADSLAEQWCQRHGVPTQVFAVTKQEWFRLGLAAGPLRNQRMFDESRPDVVVAFPGGRGTASMVQIAKTGGVAIIEVSATLRP